MPRGPFGFRRLFGIGPFVETDGGGGDDGGFVPPSVSHQWVVDHRLAHHIWEKTEKSNAVGWGPFTILLSAFMNFFEGRGRHDSLNNWLFTRVTGELYDENMWYKVPNKMHLENPKSIDDKVPVHRVFEPHTNRTQPEATQVTSQQYTVHGGMFTYDYNQDDDGPGRLFGRIPVPREMSEEARTHFEGTGYEYFEFQNRTYSSQFGDPLPGMDDYFHPHYRNKNITSSEEAKLFIDGAFELMEKGVKMEREKYGGTQ